MKEVNYNKAIFLDRDWTLNYDWWYLHKVEDVKILSWVKEWLQILKDLWYKLIVISNQSWIWRWYFKIEDCNNFNAELEKQLWIKFDAIYICPHWPDEKCACRKPKTLLVEKAIKKFNLDVSKCYFVWDKESDVQMWINWWCKTVLIKNSQYECNMSADYVVDTILEFAEMIK